MQGARATHPVDGDLTVYVEACATGFVFSAVGLDGCGLNTSAVGEYTVTFSVADAASGSVVEVRRTVVVHPVCPSGDVLCSMLACSASGVCVSGRPLTVSKTNSAPLLRLADGDARVKYVGRGVEYTPCRGGDTGSACAAAPVAFDPEDGSLSEEVLACPPDECMDFGCPGHAFRHKGVSLRPAAHSVPCPFCRASSGMSDV